jgi:hypothetical protein
MRFDAAIQPAGGGGQVTVAPAPADDQTSTGAPPDVTVIVRTIGERSEAACRQLLARQVPADRLFVVNAVPFSAAVAETYRLGIAQHRPWTLCIDADVLVSSTAVADLIRCTRDVPETLFEVQGLVVDKFFGSLRPAGNHLYRTSLLPRALELIPPDGVDLRPETFTIYRMAERGYPWIQATCVVGLHDFEQWQTDVFRKAFLHAHKHEKFLGALVREWRRQSEDDDDFQVALWGAAAGIARRHTVRVSAEAAPFELFQAFRGARWTEKPALERLSLSVDEMITARVALMLQQPETCVMSGYSPSAAPSAPEPSLLSRLERARRRLGTTAMVPWLLGKVFRSVGERLEALAEATARRPHGPSHRIVTRQ